MNKTTVCRSGELTIKLERVAAESGLLEAEIIREGVRLIVERWMPPAPWFGVFNGGNANLSERVDDSLDGFGQGL
ncbi:MAG: hypothetical protein M3506_10010 [Chloroflexota bacterium]|nr:hypothetical protein [Chloroflexota bacterium]